jgi:hypothetical protein
LGRGRQVSQKIGSAKHNSTYRTIILYTVMLAIGSGQDRSRYGDSSIAGDAEQRFEPVPRLSADRQTSSESLFTLFLTVYNVRMSELLILTGTMKISEVKKILKCISTGKYMCFTY